MLHSSYSIIMIDIIHTTSRPLFKLFLKVSTNSSTSLFLATSCGKNKWERMNENQATQANRRGEMEKRETQKQLEMMYTVELSGRGGVTCGVQ